MFAWGVKSNQYLFIKYITHSYAYKNNFLHLRLISTTNLKIKNIYRYWNTLFVNLLPHSTITTAPNNTNIFWWEELKHFLKTWLTKRWSNHLGIEFWAYIFWFLCMYAILISENQKQSLLYSLHCDHGHLRLILNFLIYIFPIKYSVWLPQNGGCLSIIKWNI